MIIITVEYANDTFAQSERFARLSTVMPVKTGPREGGGRASSGLAASLDSCFRRNDGPWVEALESLNPNRLRTAHPSDPAYNRQNLKVMYDHWQYLEKEKRMQRTIFQISLTLALVIALILAPGTALAEKPSRGKDQNAKRHEQQERGKNHKEKKSRDHGQFYDNSGHGALRRECFNEQNKRFIHEYYAAQFRKGHCPPGLAKQGNGCMPPGQVKKWSIGRPLPRQVIYYDLSPSVLVQLGPAPPRHRFVRVAQDILLIAVGTGMVVDALEDIGRQ